MYDQDLSTRIFANRSLLPIVSLSLETWEKGHALAFPRLSHISNSYGWGKFLMFYEDGLM